MADPTFCTLLDVQAREPDILKIAPDSGHINVQLAAARQEIEDRLITAEVIVDLDKLGPTVKPRQLRLPAIYKTLAILYFAAAKDEESPYFSKYEQYLKSFDAAFSAINRLDLDVNEDGTIQESEQDAVEPFTGRMRRV